MLDAFLYLYTFIAAKNYKNNDINKHISFTSQIKFLFSQRTFRYSKCDKLEAIVDGRNVWLKGEKL